MMLAAQNQPSLSFRSKAIDNAMYWEQDGGLMKGRKCDKLEYLGEGVACENFETMYTGNFEGRPYLFVERHDYYWQYPDLRLEWRHKNMIYQVLLSEDDLNRLDSLKTGETYSVVPRFYNAMCTDKRDYTFLFFLMMSKELLSSAEVMYSSYERTDGRDRAERYWQGQYPPEPFITVRRVTSTEGKDVVRFRFGSLVELLDSFYFEVPYKDWRRLFEADGRKGRK